jgi:hypothetical protein
VDSGIAQLKETIYRLGFGVAGSGIVLIFTVGALFGFGFIVAGLAVSIAVHPELLNPVRTYMSTGWRVVARWSSPPRATRHVLEMLPGGDIISKTN